MTRFAANLTFLFTELPMIERFAAAKEAGFEGAEVLFPYDLATRELAAACRAAGLDFVLLNAPPPNWSGGARGFAAVPGGEDRFRRDFDRSLRFAQSLRARHVHVMAGKAEGPEALDTYLRNLTWASARAPHASLLIEPVNSGDLPGYFMNDFDLAAEVIEQIAAPNLGLLFDAYHAQLITGSAVNVWTAYQPLIRHIQIAGAPGRAEPSNGQIDYADLLGRVRASGYRGWVAAEYVPLTTTEAGLGWLRDRRLRSHKTLGATELDPTLTVHPE